MARPRLAALLAVLGALAGCAVPDGLPMPLAERFAHHAFTDDGGAPWPLSRWPVAPRLAVAGDVDRFRAAGRNIDRVLDDIGRPTGLAIGWDAAEPTAIVVVGTAGEIRATAAALGIGAAASELWFADCGGRLYEDPATRRSVAAVVLIRSDLSDRRLRSCLAQELTQMMGLAGDLDGAGDTVMDSVSTHERPTLVDRRLLYILYDERLRPGMTRAEAMPVVRQIIAEAGW